MMVTIARLAENSEACWPSLLLEPYPKVIACSIGTKNPSPFFIPSSIDVVNLKNIGID